MQNMQAPGSDTCCQDVCKAKLPWCMLHDGITDGVIVT